MIDESKKIFSNTTSVGYNKSISTMEKESRLLTKKLPIESEKIRELKSLLTSYGITVNKFSSNNFNPIVAYVDLELYRLTNGYLKKKYEGIQEQNDNVEFL